MDTFISVHPFTRYTHTPLFLHEMPTFSVEGGLARRQAPSAFFPCKVPLNVF